MILYKKVEISTNSAVLVADVGWLHDFVGRLHAFVGWLGVIFRRLSF
ncbi:hypothetical protein [Allobacillus sp. GCM10007490]